MGRRMRSRLAILALVWLTGCSSDEPAAPVPSPAIRVATPAPTIAAGCSLAEVAAGRARLDTLRAQWKDARALAAVTARIALAGPVSEMQRIRAATQSADVPDCLRRARHLLGEQMTSTIDVFCCSWATTSTQPHCCHRWSPRKRRPWTKRLPTSAHARRTARRL
jgi:hypothetical protein